MNKVIIMKDTGGYRVYVMEGDRCKHTVWKPFLPDANRAARALAHYYTDDNGQDADIVRDWESEE